MVGGDVEGSREHRTLGGDGNHLVVGEIEGRTDAVAVAQGEHVAGSGAAAHHETAVPTRGLGVQHALDVELRLDGAGQLGLLQRGAQLMIEP